MLTAQTFFDAFQRSASASTTGRGVSLEGLLGELEAKGQIDQASAAKLRGLPVPAKDLFLRNEKDVERVFALVAPKTVGAQTISAPMLGRSVGHTAQRPELTKLHEIARPKLDDARKSETVRRWLDRDAFTSAFLPPSEGHDAFLSELLAELGFAGLPHVVSKTELDRALMQGERELLRGVTGPEFAEELRSGKLYAGTGSCGNGIYTVSSVRADYAGSKAEGGVVMRMSLKRGAKVVDDETLDDAMSRDRAAMKARAAKDVEVLRTKARAKEATGDPKAAQKLRAEAERLLRDTERLELLLFTDPGRYAAHQGYDAVEVKGRAIYLVLNRTALRVQDEDHRG
ncbi:hypothetical protein L6R52_09150 [Myxococcota bacterium]|nr:hypothetical protein [Myxococcota bacterium]